MVTYKGLSVCTPTGSSPSWIDLASRKKPLYWMFHGASAGDSILGLVCMCLHREDHLDNLEREET